MREMKKLGELGDVFIGLTYKPEDVVDENGTIVLRSSNIQDGKLDFGDIVRVSCNVRDKLWVKENDILMCSRNGSAKLVGKTALISNLQEDMTFGAFMTIIRTPYNGYLQYFFKSPMFRRQLNSSATTTINQITRSMLDNIDVPVFDNDTADNIKAILGKCEKIIQERKVEINALDDLIKARFVELFGDMVINPNGWDKCLLGEVCDVRDGTHDSPKYFTEGYPLVTSKNVTGGKIDFSDCSLICEEDYNKINKRSKVDMGDILMPMIGTVGNPVIVDIEAEFAIKNVALIKFRENSTVINTFVKALLESDYFDRAVISKVRGGTQKFISLGDIRKLEICLPPLEVQNQFADFVHQVDKSKVAVQKSLDETQQLFDSLMQQYFG